VDAAHDAVEHRRLFFIFRPERHERLSGRKKYSGTLEKQNGMKKIFSAGKT